MLYAISSGIFNREKYISPAFVFPGVTLATDPIRGTFCVLLFWGIAGSILVYAIATLFTKHPRQALLVLGIALLLVFLFGVGINAMLHGSPWHVFDNRIVPTGQVIVETRELGDFTNIEIIDIHSAVSVVLPTLTNGLFCVTLLSVEWRKCRSIYYACGAFFCRNLMNISARYIDFKELNERVKATTESVCIDECFGQRFIGSGLHGRTLTINGTPGNALGAYLDGGTIEVNGNAQDATGDTMNDGKIIIHGNAGDALGYAMRGGGIYVRGDTGYRTGIHMKEYKDKIPVIVIGGRVGSFLGEYLAGGLIVVLGIDSEEIPVGNFTGTGMHGGKIFIRTNNDLSGLPNQVTTGIASTKDLQEIQPHVTQFAGYFGMDAESLIKSRFYVLKPNAKNPYKQLYTAN